MYSYKRMFGFSLLLYFDFNPHSTNPRALLSQRHHLCGAHWARATERREGGACSRVEHTVTGCCDVMCSDQPRWKVWWPGHSWSNVNGSGHGGRWPVGRRLCWRPNRSSLSLCICLSVTSLCFARVHTRQWLNALAMFDEMHNLEYVKYYQTYLSTKNQGCMTFEVFFCAQHLRICRACACASKDSLCLASKDTSKHMVFAMVCNIAWVFSLHKFN